MVRFVCLKTLLICFSFIACPLLASAENVTLRVRADQWMPFNGEPDDERPGYVVEIARAIFGPHGITVDYQSMPWSDALAAAAASEVDAVIGANAKEGAALVLPREPIGMPRVGLFVRKDSTFKFTGIRGLRSVRLGAIESYSYWDALDQYIESAGKKIVFFNSDNALVEAITQLHTGAIDVLPETLPVFIWTARSLGHATTDFRTLYVEPGEALFLAFAPNDLGRRHAKLFDDGMQELRKSGALAEILTRYGLTDWK